MTIPIPKAEWTSAGSLEAVRPQVREFLRAIPAFGALPDEERRALAANMVKVMSYIADPNGVRSDPQVAASRLPSTPPPTARAMDQADTIKNFGSLNEQTPDKTGQNFYAGGVREGTEAFGALVQKVDFPKFVGGLIRNVFQAIVESSIEQMRAYGELISNVAKTVDQFMTDNISAGAGRDWLADRYPDTLGVEVSPTAGAFAEGDQPPAPTAVLVAQGESPEVRLAEISRDMNINPPITDISDADAELRLVTAARLQMARQRQQLLSSMVMLGINRIVVTDGSINAKVVFDMRGTSEAKASNTASMYDQEAQRKSKTLSASYGGWFSPVKAGFSATESQEHVATVASAVDESSTDKAEVKARLSGDVRVNFKSDYLPLEKMATPEMMSVIQGNSTPYNPNNKPATEPGAAR